MTEIHISSLIIQAPQAHFSALQSLLTQFPRLEIAAIDTTKGKIIVVVEASSLRELDQMMATIKDLEGVITVTLVYHHVEQQSALEEDIS